MIDFISFVYIKYNISLIDLNTVNELSKLAFAYESFVILDNNLILLGLL